MWAITKFQRYLYGRPFRVVSDHHSLCWLVSIEDASRRLARWSLRLQELDVTIVHKSGQKHSDADCLSLAPVGTGSTDLEGDCGFLAVLAVSDLARQQREDLQLRPLIDYLEGRTSQPPHEFERHMSSFCICNDVLYKCNFHPNDTSYLLVVPSGLRE